MRDKDDIAYLVCIIDHFSKFVNAYLLKTKTSEEILVNIKNFINNYGKCKTFHSDNENEFLIIKLETYCKENGINFIHRRPFHPQSQDYIESSNKKYSGY